MLIFTCTFLFLNSVLRPFQDYFSSYETGQLVGGGENDGMNPEKNHLAHPKAELVARAGVRAPTAATAVIFTFISLYRLLKNYQGDHIYKHIDNFHTVYIKTAERHR